MDYSTHGGLSRARVHYSKNNLATRLNLIDHLPLTLDWPQELSKYTFAERERCFTIEKTLEMFLQQTFNADKSCQLTVIQTLVHRYSKALPGFSSNTAAYCKARKRLPTELVSDLTTKIGNHWHENSKNTWKWCGRSVKIVDGTTVSMPDTPENQAEYPQISAQKPGIGFPIARLLAIISLSSGTILEMAMGDYHTSEHVLLRQLLEHLKPGDVLLGDNYYCAYFLIAMLIRKGVDCVFKLNTSRKFIPTRGKRLGKDDHLMLWYKPEARPHWLDKKAYQEMPKTLTIREFKKNGIVIATTLLSNKAYHRKKIFALYKERWQIELNFRAIKTTMQMDILRCRCPEMIRKEIWVTLLAYNILRGILCRTSLQYRKLPRRLSFKMSLQSITLFYVLSDIVLSKTKDKIYEQLLHMISQHCVGKRPNRVEPRAIKRRPKPRLHLMEPRHLARQKLIQNRILTSLS